MFANRRPPSPVVIMCPSTATIASPGRIFPYTGEPGVTVCTIGSELKSQVLSLPSVVIVQLVHSKLEMPIAPRGGRPSGHT